MRDRGLRELDLARRVLGDGAPGVETVFVGGGTPTLLPAADLVLCCAAYATGSGWSPDAEVTTEANPDSVSAASLAELAEGGFTRVSLGMQSAVPHVLATLDRTHDPANVAARGRAGPGPPGSTSASTSSTARRGSRLDDWRRSLDTALALEPDHVSAYALVVEEGTRLAAQVRRGEVPAPEDDDEADKYELADERPDRRRATAGTR